jgi:hypothetical protein
VSLHSRNIKLSGLVYFPLVAANGAWHSRGMVQRESDQWLTVPDVCERLGVTPGKVHRFVEERALLGMKREGVFCIPEIFLDGSEPLGDLRGTAVVLMDGGFTQESAIEWLLHDHEVLGARPIDALRQGRKTEVRRLAQSLAF